MSDYQSTTAIQRVPFHSDEILTVKDERTEKEYVLPKAIAQTLGLNWSGQRQRLQRNKLFAQGVCIMHFPSDGGEQNTLLLERRLFHAWLMTIETNRLANADARRKILLYQHEAAAALDAYWTTGLAVNPRFQESNPLSVFRAQHALIGQMLDALGTLDERVTTLESRRPPADTLRVQDWISQQGKPRLYGQLWDRLKSRCREIEEPQMWRPEGMDWPLPYYSPYTIALAYAEVTAQLTFLHEAKIRYGKSRHGSVTQKERRTV